LSLKVPPSKMNLIKFRRTLTFLRRAHTLLEEKRDILLLEINRRIGEASKLRSELNSALREAYRNLDDAASVVGTTGIAVAGKSPQLSFEIGASKRKIMGVTTTSLEVKAMKKTLSYNIAEPTVFIDEALASFQRSIPIIVRVAELEAALVRLVEEVKRTQRRINALEQFLIPQYSSTVSLISSILEERDREEFVRVKKVKSLIERRSMKGAKP